MGTDWLSELRLEAQHVRTVQERREERIIALLGGLLGGALVVGLALVGARRTFL